MTPPRRALSAVVGLAMVVGTVVGVTPAAGAATGTATCVDPSTNTTWRVDWSSRATIYGQLAKPTAFYKRVGTGAWTSANSSTWAMRWDNTPNVWAGAWVNPFVEVLGTASQLASTEAAVYLSPRWVSPDGGCDAYAFPFANGSSTWPKIAVVGDSLTQQLNDPTYNATYLQGFVQGNLNANGRRAEVEGQGGRRWTADLNQSGLGRANSTLLDEIRGLRAAAPRGIVVALGANDAGWVASGTTDAIRQSRLSGVLSQLTTIVNELGTYGICVVSVTGPESLANYYGVSSPWYYAWAAQQINNWLRYVAAVNPNDWFRLRDFAAESANHHTVHPDNWFLGDNLHLNDAGKLHYTSSLVSAGLMC